MKQELLEKLVMKLIDWEVETTEKTTWSENIWKYVIIRGYDSWVHFGKLDFASPWLYRLSNSRRLWRWWALKWIWLTSVAMYWLHTWHKDEIKVCVAIPKIEITDNRICEIIPCTDEVIKQIQEWEEFNPS